MIKPSSSGLTAKESILSPSNIWPMGRSLIAYLASSNAACSDAVSLNLLSIICALLPLQVHPYPKIVEITDRKSFFHRISQGRFVLYGDGVKCARELQEPRALLMKIAVDAAQNLRQARSVCGLSGTNPARAPLYLQPIDIVQRVAQLYLSVLLTGITCRRQASANDEYVPDRLHFKALDILHFQSLADRA
jgi:hypothetical protein